MSTLAMEPIRAAQTSATPADGEKPTLTEGWRRELLTYVAALLVCGFLLQWVLHIDEADFRVPLGDGGDCTLTQVMVKNVIERRAYYRCDRIAAPYGVDLRDFPMSENLHFGVLKLLALGTKNPNQVINFFYLLTYFFVTVTALFTFRRFGVAPLPAVVAALLYAFLPYHTYRSVGHLFLSGYYMIPPMVLVVLWLYLGRFQRQTHSTPESATVFWGRWLLALVICLLVSGAGVYYAYFGCFFLLVAGLAGSLQRRQWTPLLNCGSFLSVIVLGLVVNLLPCLVYQHAQGSNPDVGNRLKWESEFYGLKLSHLLLPIADHRSDQVRHWKELYSYLNSPMQEGCISAPLGAVGALGFGFVIFTFLFGKKTGGSPRLVYGLGLLAVCGLLLGSVGGLGTLFANFVSPQIRAYNRVSIYLGFFALFGVALFLTWLLDWSRRLGLPGRLAAGAVCLLLLAGGVWDQTNKNMVPPYAANKAALDSRTAFVAQIEQRLPSGALVFQLPIVHFPEAPPVNRIDSYDHFRLYLVSHSLCWSHGTMNSRYGAKVMATLTQQPIEAVVERIVAMGFVGLHLDRLGYADNGREVEARLRNLLGQEPLVSDDGRDVFFDLSPYSLGKKSQYTEEEWAESQDWYRYPVVALWAPGADRLQDDWRWCRSPATLSFINPLKKTRKITLRFVPDFPMQDGKPQDPKPHLTVTGAVVGGAVPLDTNGTAFSMDIDVPPGRSDLRFDCDGLAAHDEHGRTLVFRLLNMVVVCDETPPEHGGAVTPTPATSPAEPKPATN